MTTARDWRSPRSADDFADLDYADFAQEFLRRNPDYRRDYDATLTCIAAGDLDHEQAMAELAIRWGLSFPLRPRPHRHRGARPVGARSRCRHGRPCCRPG